MRRSRWLALLAVLSAMDMMVLGCQGCTNPPPPEVDAGTDASVDPGVPDASVDAGPDDLCTTDQDCTERFGPNQVCNEVQASETYGHCVDKCKIDDDCEPYKLGLRCEENSGHCIAARGCNDDTNCPGPDTPDDYCWHNGIQCRCVTGEQSQDGFPGVCRRRHGVCEECTDDTQCGYAQPPQPSVFDPPGRCLAMSSDPDGMLPDGGTRRYCFFQESSATCGCGMIRDPASGTCMPQKHTCSQVGCTLDKDCPFGSVCNAAACLCEPRCIWNFDRKELNPPGCPPGKSCWVDPENLDPESKYFGAGRCRAPCENDAMCQANDSRLVCKGEKEEGGGMSENRCRPDGQCMDDLECDPQPQGSVALGYCDRSNFTCKNDCRVGTDPVTNAPYDDCISGYQCFEGVNGAPNECKRQTCVQLGGARLGCAVGEYCCGEDRDGDGVAEPCPLSGVDPETRCYPAPTPPFCVQCMINADCNTPGSNINNSPMPSICIYAGDRPDGTMGVNICAPATYNDNTVNENGVPKTARGCPSKYTSVPIKVKCMTPADCGPTGLCDADMSVTFPDGGHPLACLCRTDGTATSTAGCPGDADAGNQTFCKYGAAGTTSICLQSVVCNGPPGIAYRSTDEGGCGF